MKQFYRFVFILLLFQFPGLNNMMYSSVFIPANNPNIQYFGRWDMSDSIHLKHSWPGIYVYAEFSGTSIGVRMNDSVNYYNVYSDGKFYKVFHGDKNSEEDYTLGDSLTNTRHTFRLSQRNISFGIYTFSGLLLSDGGKLLSVPEKPERKIEFIGDSYTAAEGNEATEPEMQWEAKFPVTNIDKGFATIIARHYNAQYHTTCRSGIGMVCDWQGKFDISMPNYFDRALMEKPEPKWDFKKWIPDLVIICLGLNDLSGLKGKDEKISEENSGIFRNGYHDFLKTVRKVYHGVPIIAVAADPEWIRENVKKVVHKEKAEGYGNIYYAQFSHYPRGYVANNHPSVQTHEKIANEIINAIDKYQIFSAKN
jgi:Carbohydrate esterase 2 N-terminal